MNGELMPYAQGQVKVPREDRGVARAAKAIYDETRIDGFTISAVNALAKHAMDETKALDDHRRQLAGDDPVLNIALGEIEQAAVRGAAGIVRRRADPNAWNL